MLLPNARAIRSSYFINVLDKIVIDNPVSQSVLRAAARRNSLGMVRIRLRPGNIYFFCGYRPIHTNEPVDHDKLRVTALFHYANPHQNSWTRRMVTKTAAKMKEKFCSAFRLAAPSVTIGFHSRASV